MPSTNQYIDEIYDTFSRLQVGERMEIDLSQLGYTGDEELVIPMYFFQKFAAERLRLILKQDANYIQKEAGTPGIYFKS